MVENAGIGNREHFPARDGTVPRKDIGVQASAATQGGGLDRAGNRADTEAQNVAGAKSGDSRLGLTVTHRRYVPYSHAHYAGNLVDGAYVLGLFGDVATEVCIRSDGDEGLFASYGDVQFRAPVRAGDVIEAQATIVRIGQRSREIAFEARIICRGHPETNESAAEVLSEPILATTATGTVVVPSR